MNLRVLCNVIVAAVSAAYSAAYGQTPPTPPPANSELFERNGVAYRDPFRAMQDDYSKFAEWQAAESAYAEKVLAKAPLRKKMFERIKALDAAGEYSATPHYAGDLAIFLKADGASFSLFRQRAGEEPAFLLSHEGSAPIAASCQDQLRCRRTARSLPMAASSMAKPSRGSIS